MKDEIATCILFFMAVIFVVVCFVVAEQRDDLKAEAVKRGCAEWIVDEHGNTTWQWKTINQKN